MRRRHQHPGVAAGRDWLLAAAVQLVAQQRADGSFPGPAGAGCPLMQAGDTEDRARFLGNYHTTLVALLAVTLTARLAGGAPLQLP